jgi:two-component system response regulator (stage 0 sporulation protein F)
MKTILVVEREQEAIAFLSDVLNRYGYNVIAKQCSWSALSVVRDGAKVDLVITEEHLPEMDGLEFLASLKEFDSSVPSIMLTDHGSVESYLRAINLGAFEYLNKPLSAKEISRVVTAAIEWSLGRASSF